MTRGQIIDIDDHISGCCPACQCPDIECVCTSIAGNQTYQIREYVLRCRHEGVCWMRREFMEEDK